MLRAGAGAYLVKGEGGTDEIVDAIHRCARGPDGRTHLAALAPPSVGAHPFRSRERLQRIEAVVAGEGVEMVYQPIFDLGDGRPVGAEALCRFEVAPLRTPDVWFAEAAEVGLGIELEIAAMRRAIRRLDRLEGSMVLGVNVSPNVLLDRSASSARVGAIGKDRPGNNRARSGGRLRGAQGCARSSAGRGVGLAIDDTCSGFASLRHVLKLRPDTIELDVTLTLEIEPDAARRSLVEALAGFASNVGAKLLAEGIETAEQLRILGEVGVRSGQGYFLGRPGRLPRFRDLARPDLRPWSR